MKINPSEIKRITSNTKVFFKGLTYANHNRVKNLKITGGIESTITADVIGSTDDYLTQIKYNNVYSKVVSYKCSCPAYFSYEGACKHIAATLFAINTAPKKLATSNYAMQLINRRANKIASDAAAQTSQTLSSVLFTLCADYNQRLYLSLKVGSSRMYVVKNLPEFKERLKNGEVASYGKNYSLLHNLNSFNEPSRALLQFFLSYYSESYVNENGAYYSYADSKKFFFLQPFAIDKLFTTIGGEINVDIEDIASGICKIVHGNPHINVKIQSNNNELFEIRLQTKALFVIHGISNIYMLHKSTIYVCEKDFGDTVSDFIESIQRSDDEFTVIADDMRAFYTTVVLPLQNYIDIDCDSDLSQYYPLPLTSELYLDMPYDNTVTARLDFVYGNDRYSAYGKDRATGSDIQGEMYVKGLMHKYFEYINEKNEAFFEDNEEKLYTLLHDGISEFSSVCDVFMTDSFKEAKIRTTPSVSVGIKLESELLDIKLDTGDIDIKELIGILKSYRLAKKYHKLRDGSFIELESNAIGELSGLIDNLALSEKDLMSGQVSVPKYRALYLDNMIKQSEEIKYERSNNFKKIVRDLKDVSDSDIEVPAELKKTLRNYQKNGFRWLKTMSIYNFGGILADDMGLGKTLQVIALLQDYKNNDGKLSSIVVCPSSLVLNWESELHRFAPNLSVVCILGSNAVRKELLDSCSGTDVLVTSYDLLKRDIEDYEKLKFEYEIIDEAQYIKNHTTQNAKAVKLLNSSKRFALTGTPVENTLAELWSVFDYLMPGYLYNYNKFRQKFESPIVKSRNESALAALKKMVSPFILRRLKQEVLKELPPKTETVMYASLEGEQKKVYMANLATIKDELSVHFQKEGFENSKLIILAMLTRLRQLCCDPHLMYENYSGESAKLEMCMELVSGSIASGHKLLLFSQFTSMLSLIEARLNEANISYYKIIGDTKKEVRFDLVNKFNADKTPVFLISLKAGGTGLNLTGADIVIHYDPWWNVSAQNQATDRVHRIGQKNSVTVYKLIAKDTIEEKILKLQKDKAELANMVIDGSNGAISNMSRDEIAKLFE